MFYEPKPVESWDDQLTKWWNAWIYQFTPMPFFVLWFNFWSWLLDEIENIESNDPYRVGVYPRMYTNWFAESVMSDPEVTYGLFVWYDMFSWQGFWNYFFD